jgi:hypothetical protein
VPIDAKIEADKLRKLYAEDPRQKSLNVLLLGESGSGKSFLASTCPRPVHIDSFDPGGTKGLRKWIDKGDIIPDIKYEKEDPLSPSAYSTWKTEFKYRTDNGYFNQMGTYILDSATTWSETIMNAQLMSKNSAGESPKWNRDYEPQKQEIRNWLRRAINLPCTFILTGHLEAKKVIEGEAESLEYRFLTTGKASIVIPLLFDEIWVMLPKEIANGVEYRILTKSTGKHLARSRLAEEGKLSQFEKPDVKALLKKVGFNFTDNPIPK